MNVKGDGTYDFVTIYDINEKLCDITFQIFRMLHLQLNNNEDDQTSYNSFNKLAVLHARQATSKQSQKQCTQIWKAAWQNYHIRRTLYIVT